jgi:hypothetical protein
MYSFSGNNSAIPEIGHRNYEIDGKIPLKVEFYDTNGQACTR